MEPPPSLIDHTTDVIFVVDETGRFTYLNSTAEEVLGYAPSDLEGTDGFELIHSEDRSRARKEFGKLLEDPEYVGEVEFRAKHEDGSIVMLEVRARNRIDDPSINGIVVVGRDITERKEYERALERQNDRLDKFATLVSHDLRNPLNVAQGRVGLVMDTCESGHLDAVAQALDRMESLINDMLSWTRAGESIEEMKPVQVAQLAESCWRNVDTKSGQLVVDIRRTVMAHDSRLQQLLENLFRNAIEHGGQDVTVTIGELATGFYVEDDGPGIPEEEQSRIFEAGYSTREEGTGFGLNIVKELVQAHGWKIQVTTGSEGGARFEITGIESPPADDQADDVQLAGDRDGCRS